MFDSDIELILLTLICLLIEPESSNAIFLSSIMIVSLKYVTGRLSLGKLYIPWFETNSFVVYGRELGHLPEPQPVLHEDERHG